MFALPQSDYDDVRARPWHFGVQVVAGPAWEASGNGAEQVADPRLVRALVVEPGGKTSTSGVAAAWGGHLEVGLLGGRWR